MFNNRLAIVTGASSGIGSEIALLLAQKGCDVVLVARRAEALEQRAKEIQEATGRSAHVHAADLSLAQQREELAAAFPQADILINNAGFGVYGRFVESEWQRVEQMLDLDIKALTHLTHLFAAGMKERGWGRILQVASTASFQPCPGYASYGAAKSYVLSFSLAVDFELKTHGVRSLCLCPGVTQTEFFEVSGQKMTLFQRKSMMTAREVAEVGIKIIEQERTYDVAGTLNKLLAHSTRFTPTALLTYLTDKLMRAPGA